MRNPPTPAAAPAAGGAGACRPAPLFSPHASDALRPTGPRRAAPSRRRWLSRLGSSLSRWRWAPLLALVAVGACADQPTAALTPPEAALADPPRALAIPAGPYVPGQAYFGRNAYVEYLAGNAPVIIVAPHGGTLVPTEIPDRTATACGGVAQRATDTNVRELARAIQQRHFARFGTYPHVVLLHLRRTKLDANRAILEAACGDAEAEIAWHEWHGFIEAAKAAVLASTGKGWFIDLHGHTHDIERLELGYVVTGKQLDLSDAALDADTTYESTASVQTISRQAPASFSALLRGSKSLGAMYADSGYPAVPSTNDPGPRGAEYFSGGYNTERHACGSRAALHGGAPGGDICGVQIESNFIGVRDNSTNRTRFADVTVAVLEEYLRLHWGLLLGSPPPPPPPANTPPAAKFDASCTGLTCTFLDRSTDAIGAVTAWQWTFGDGATSTVRNPSRTYAAAGTYAVSLVVTDDSAATGSTSSSVTVTAPPPNVPPTASFTVRCTDLTCTFTDASSDADGSIVSRDWAFGDGATSTAANPTRSYGAAGTYTVTLTVRDDSAATGSTSAATTVTAPPPPPSVTLTVSGAKTKGNGTASLSWTGATSQSVDVFRDGTKRTTTANDGEHTDALGKSRGTFTYRVCHAGTTICSNTASVRF